MRIGDHYFYALMLSTPCFNFNKAYALSNKLWTFPTFNLREHVTYLRLTTLATPFRNTGPCHIDHSHITPKSVRIWFLDTRSSRLRKLYHKSTPNCVRRAGQLIRFVILTAD